MRAVGIEGILRSLTGGDFRRVSLQIGDILLRRFIPRLRQSAAHAPRKLRRQLRMGLLIRSKLLLPAFLRLLPFFTRIPGPVNLFRDLKRRVMPAEFLTRQRHFLFPQRGAVGLFFPGFIRRTEAYHRTADNQRGFVLHALGFQNRFLHGFGVVAVNFMHHMPVIGLKAFCRVIGKPAFGFTINGNAVVVVEADQLAQS